jgi:hypothetical protein
MNTVMDNQTMTEGRKTLSVDVDTWERLKKFGLFGESYPDLFNRILDELEDCRKEKEKVRSRK